MTNISSRSKAKIFGPFTSYFLDILFQTFPKMDRTYVRLKFDSHTPQEPHYFICKDHDDKKRHNNKEIIMIRKDKLAKSQRVNSGKELTEKINNRFQCMMRLLPGIMDYHSHSLRNKSKILSKKHRILLAGTQFPLIKRDKMISALKEEIINMTSSFIPNKIMLSDAGQPPWMRKRMEDLIRRNQVFLNSNFFFSLNTSAHATAHYLADIVLSRKNMKIKNCYIYIYI